MKLSNDTARCNGRIVQQQIPSPQTAITISHGIANPTETIEPYGDDPCAATRRAIVLAAAVSIPLISGHRSNDARGGDANKMMEVGHE